MSLPLRLPVVMLMSVALAACGTPPLPTTTVTASPATAATSSGPPMSASPTVEPSSLASEAPIAAEPPPLALELVVGGLQAPTNIVGAPNGRLLVTERSGRILAVDPIGGEATDAADLSDRVMSGTSRSDERGLLGLALHPDWPRVARAFVHYTDRDGNTVLAELAGEVIDGVPRLNPGSETVLLRVTQPYRNHNGGQLVFGPDGMLWLGLGDGGGGGDPHETGQEPDDLLGSILRLDVDDPSAGLVPADAPFADGGGAGEVHLYGLRNPWRFSFDAATGELWIADVGQRAYEEVDRLDPVANAGANLGWNVMEASHCYEDPSCSSEGLVLPVSEYGRERGCSITGGYVYRGEAVAGLAGWYLFADWCAGTIFGIRSDVTDLTAPRDLLLTDLPITTFGQDAAGELYVADLDGGLYRIVGGD